MTHKSTKDEGIHKRGSENIYKNNPGPRGPASSVKSPLASFKLLFTDAMIRMLFSTRLYPTCARKIFGPPLKMSDKYPHFKLVDLIYIEAFTDILYLRSTFRLNLQSRETIWSH